MGAGWSEARRDESRVLSDHAWGCDWARVAVRFDGLLRDSDCLRGAVGATNLLKLSWSGLTRTVVLVFSSHDGEARIPGSPRSTTVNKARR